MQSQLSKPQLRAIADLRPSARNPRTHSSEQIARIAASITEYGWTNPVLITSDGQIIAGHGRLEAAKRLGLKTVPVLVLDHLTAEQRRAYVIADNKLADLAGWDDDLLAAELGELQSAGFDLSLTGFDADELSALLSQDPSDPSRVSDDAAAEDESDTAIARRGDIWILGRHRLACGDSTAAADVQRLLRGARPHLMVTDPPYGVEYDASWRQKIHPSAGAATGRVLNDDRADWREAWELFPGAVAYVWHAGSRCHEVAASLVACKFDIRAQIVWVKQRLVISRGDYHPQHEPAYYAVRHGEDEQWGFEADHDIATYAVLRGEPGRYRGGRKQSTVWHIEHSRSDTGHSTQKPVECMRRPILNNSRPGDAVYEPFAGSGTTIIAAESVGRNCYAMELNPAYVDMIVRRWQKFTRLQATLEGDGRAFTDVEADRFALGVG